MSEAVRFLHALAQALSTMGLYSPGHPAARRALDGAWQALAALLEKDAHPVFLFLGSAPVFSGRALHELAAWPWSTRLSAAGVQRLEFDASMSVDGLALFLERVMVRFNTGLPAADEAGAPIPGVVFGTVAVQEAQQEAESGEGPALDYGDAGREVHLALAEELDAVAYIRAEAARGGVARGEADAVVRILASLLDQHPFPQVHHEADPARYPVVHAVNTTLLAMAAGSDWLDRTGRQRLGLAALLHDIGMARLPMELALRDALTPAERAQVESHTRLGAELLLAHGGRGAELAAVVAYEHHLRPDGTGYPQRRFRPAPHWASRLVGAAAAFTALRSQRPFRPAWHTDRALGHLLDGGGTLFDMEAAQLVAAVVRPD